MKAAPQDKKRLAVYIGIIVVAGGAAAYFAFGRRGEGPTPTDAKVQQHAAEIQSTATTPPEAPAELPVEKRAPRGAQLQKR